MEKETIFELLEKEIEYHLNVMLMCGHDGIVHNQCQAIINELETIKKKFENETTLKTKEKPLPKICDVDFEVFTRRQKEDGTQKLVEAMHSQHKWQTYKMEEISNLTDVLQNLFIWSFAVKIDNNFYDIEFGKDAITNRVSYMWSGSPSPNLNSYEIIQQAFTKGIWYRICMNKRKE